MSEVLLRFNDLKARKIVSNWPTLLRWIKSNGFPAGRQLGPNSRVWFEAEVNRWLEDRPPPEIRKPAPSGATEGSGLENAGAGNPSNSSNKRIGRSPQVSTSGANA
jgi:predicted DNA-binding transcriptional regulator AlpA